MPLVVTIYAYDRRIVDRRARVVRPGTTEFTWTINLERDVRIVPNRRTNFRNTNRVGLDVFFSPLFTNGLMNNNSYILKTLTKKMTLICVSIKKISSKNILYFKIKKINRKIKFVIPYLKQNNNNIILTLLGQY